jgi:TfoX/Sxy family transcriptional regulator of competence genes
MKMPKVAAPAVERFRALASAIPSVEQKLVFGQPAAFVNGNMFFGVFGDQLFVRLSEADTEEARDSVGGRPFEPMAGRPMRGYTVLPSGVWADPKRARQWVERSLQFAQSLPSKKARRAGH